MSTHEIKATDLTWADFMFESREDAFNVAAQLEKLAQSVNLTDAQREAIDERLDDLFATLFPLD